MVRKGSTRTLQPEFRVAIAFEVRLLPAVTKVGALPLLQINKVSLTMISKSDSSLSLISELPQIECRE